MEFGICNLAQIPLRAAPDHRSEMTSQVLFGEAFAVTAYGENWVKVLTLADQYEGWIGSSQFAVLKPSEYQQLATKTAPVTWRAVTQAWKKPDNSVLYLPAGSSLSFLKGTTCHIRHDKFEIIGEIGERESLELTARSFLNTPYLWGGRTHHGIDCSGFSQAVYRLQGIRLRRDAWMQAEEGEAVASLSQTRLGDLAFFNNDLGKIVHVGILLSRHEIIHASGQVKIDRIDDEGIFSEAEKRYTHRLCLLRRILSRT